MVTLPSTNLLLQDARPGVTPLRRGLTRVHEARARGITVLVGSDNVQDAFCRGGSIDPVEAFLLAVNAAQLEDPFDAWSIAIARPDALDRTPAPQVLGPGSPADLVCFEARPDLAWPDLSARRRILRGGDWLATRQDTLWTPTDLTPSSETY
jgi:cytosine deaminase